jgi:hypothetical protein
LGFIVQINQSGTHQSSESDPADLWIARSNFGLDDQGKTSFVHPIFDRTNNIPRD